MRGLREDAGDTNLGRRLGIGRIDDRERRRAALDQRQRRADVFRAHHFRRHLRPDAELLERRLPVFSGGHGGIRHRQWSGGQYANERSGRANGDPHLAARRCRNDEAVAEERDAGRWQRSGSSSASCVHPVLVRRHEQIRRRTGLRPAARAPTMPRTRSVGFTWPFFGPRIGGRGQRLLQRSCGEHQRRALRLRATRDKACR